MWEVAGASLSAAAAAATTPPPAAASGDDDDDDDADDDDEGDALFGVEMGLLNRENWIACDV